MLSNFFYLHGHHHLLRLRVHHRLLRVHRLRHLEHTWVNLTNSPVCEFGLKSIVNKLYKRGQKLGVVGDVFCDSHTRFSRNEIS